MPDIFTSPHEKKEQEQPKAEPQQRPAEQIVQQKTQQEPITAEPHPLAQQAQKTTQKHPVSNVLKSSRNPVQLLSHYCENPVGLHFINQEDTEEIILFLRRHLATNIPWAFITLALLFFPPVVFYAFNVTNFTLFSIPASLVFILTGFYYLIVLNYALLNFITWFYDIGIVSKKRLIDLDADNILHHHWAETELGDVVDVSVTQKGFFQSFFNYGNVHIQTEAIKANFEFAASPKPATVSDIVSDLKAVVTGRDEKHE
jgi:hypothetical protein